MSKCIFCRIIDLREPASIVYQDDEFIVIMDAYPLAEGHCMVIPKQHVQRLNQLDCDARARLYEISHHVMEAQKASGFGVHGTNLLINDGKAANQSVPHVHLHLIPRKQGDLWYSLPKLALHISGLFGLKTKRASLNRMATEISSHLSL
ncbi:MAG: HIT family protein [Oleiphilus sp.]|nr:MAG: HIT family protein [Oleiphilus sp.]